jgi:hypothetical protein
MQGGRSQRPGFDCPVGPSEVKVSRRPASAQIATADLDIPILGQLRWRSFRSAMPSNRVRWR